jgi:hypothetical protein
MNQLSETKPISWLEANAQGFRDLSKEERSAVLHFTFLWSLFEGQNLNSYGTAEGIDKFVKARAKKSNLKINEFSTHLHYFRNRYVKNGKFTHHFERLEFRRHDKRNLVESVLIGKTNDLEAVITAMLIIVFRYRNNLHHGLKWAYGLQGQLDNFRIANDLLITVIDAVRQGR